MTAALAMMCASHGLYIYALNTGSFWILLLSRFVFGVGGSKVIHRKYIANHVAPAFYNKYHDLLVAYSFGGMALGPLVPLACSYLQSTQTAVAYFGLYCCVPFTVLFAW
jgi:hypothetical protein